MSDFEAEQEGVRADEVDQSYVSTVEKLVEVVLQQRVQLSVHEQSLSCNWTLALLSLLFFVAHGDLDFVVVLAKFLVHD